MSRSHEIVRRRRLTVEALERRLCLTTFATIDLQPPAGSVESTADGLNDGSADNVVVVGSSSTTGTSQPTVWNVDKVARTAQASVLPGLNAGSFGNALEVNNQGMIAGDLSFEDIDEDGNPIIVPHAVMWTTDSTSHTAHDLGPGNAVSLSEVTNDHVWVVGRSSPTGRALVWQVSTAGNLLSTTELEPAACSARAWDVTVSDGSVFVAGQTKVDDCIGNSEAVVWQLDLNGNQLGRTDLGTLGGITSRAHGLNDQGKVVGTARTADGNSQAFLSDGVGNMSELGSLGNGNSQAAAINDHDVVVGQYENYRGKKSNEPDRYAFVWEDGAMHRLLDQISDETFWRLFGAWDVNANDEIVGSGSAGTKRDNQAHGFLAIPQDSGGQDAPVANDDSYTMQAGTTLTVAAPGVLNNDTDVDGDSLNAVLVTGPGNDQSFALNSNGSFTYTPMSGFTGTDTFTYVANDGSGNSNVATVSITVSFANSDPLYVYDIRFDSKRGNRDWRAVFEIRSDSNGNGAGDSGDNPIAGVQIEVTFAGNTYNGTTDSNGIFRTSWIKNLASGDYYANAVDLVLTGYTWDTLLDLEDDSDLIAGPDALLELF